MEGRNKLNEDTKKNSAAKKLAKVTKYRAGFLAMRAKYGHEASHGFELCTMDECCNYLQHKKLPKDKAMPGDLPGCRARCVQWIGCASLPHSFDEVDTVPMVQGGTDHSDLFWSGESDDESAMEIEETVVVPTAIWCVCFISVIFVIWLLRVNFWIDTTWQHVSFDSVPRSPSSVVSWSSCPSFCRTSPCRQKMYKIKEQTLIGAPFMFFDRSDQCAALGHDGDVTN